MQTVKTVQLNALTLGLGIIKITFRDLIHISKCIAVILVFINLTMKCVDKDIKYKTNTSLIHKHNAAFVYFEHLLPSFSIFYLLLLLYANATDNTYNLRSIPDCKKTCILYVQCVDKFVVRS